VNDSRADMSYETPTREFVQEVLSQIGDLQHRRAFFDELENPNWVKPLDREGAFKSVPRTNIDEDGYLRGSPWPEGDYLVRMAEAEPADVAAILGPLATTEDPYIQRLLLRAAVRLPSMQATRFVGTIERALQGPLRRIFDGRQVASVIEKLAADDQFKAALKLAKAAYEPRIVDPLTDEGPTPRRPEIQAGLADYLYQTTLPSVVRALSSRGTKWLATLTIWLESFQVLANHYTPGETTDTSIIWRPSIQSDDQNRGYAKIGEALVDAVRDLAMSLVTHETAVINEVLQILTHGQQPLLKRIGLFVLTERITEGDESAISIGYDFLTNPDYTSHDYRHEYAELAAALLPRLEPSQAESWETLVLTGPPLEHDELERRARRWRTENESELQATIRYREVWQLQLLAAVGMEALRETSAEKLEEFQSRYGTPEHPRFPSFSSSGLVTVRGPLQASELADKPLEDVLELLRTWSPAGDTLSEPSIAGLATELEADVRRRPSAYAMSAPAFSNFRAPYARALFSALSDHLTDTTRDEWNSILNLADQLSATVAGGTLTDTEDTQPALRALIAFTEKAITLPPTDTADEPPLGRLLDVLTPLTRHPDPTPEYEADYGGDNMDPITLSLNSTRPAAIYAVMRLFARAVATAKQYSSPQGSPDTRALEVLESQMGAGRDPSLAVAATYGRGLGILTSANGEWTAARLPQLLAEPGTPPNAEYSDVVITTYLAAYSPFAKVLELIRPFLKMMLLRSASGEAITLGWRRERGAVELIGDHLVALVVTGDIAMSDSLLSDLFTLAPASDRASILGHLGWIIMQSDSVSEDSLQRAKDLVEWRLDKVRSGESEAVEFGQFHWWVEANKWPEKWWLDIAGELAGSVDLDPHGVLGEHLEVASERFPAQTLRILSKLLALRPEAYQRYDLIEHAPAIIAAAIESENEALVTEARDLMNQLGREGNLHMGDLVEQKRRAAKQFGS
jgi:hypothetical protein